MTDKPCKKYIMQSQYESHKNYKILFAHDTKIIIFVFRRNSECRSTQLSHSSAGAWLIGAGSGEIGFQKEAIADLQTFKNCPRKLDQQLRHFF